MKRLISVLPILFLIASLVLSSSVFAGDSATRPIYIPGVYNITGIASANISDVKPERVPPIDTATLKPCDLEAIAKAGPGNPEPDFSSKVGCLVTSTQVDISDPDLPLEDVPVPNDTNVGAASVHDALIPRKLAMHVMDCTSCTATNGVIHFSSVFSAKTPTLPNSSYSWGNYFYGNYMAVRKTIAGSITCQSGQTITPRIGMGIGKGRLSPTITLSNMMVFWHRYVNGSCYGYTNSLAIAPQSAIYMQMWRSLNTGGQSYWTGAYWYASQWQYLFIDQQMPFDGSAPSIFYGQEIGAVNSDFSAVKSPVNFAHKTSIQSASASSPVSWQEKVAPAQYFGKTTTFADPPFNVMDLVGGEFTSISSTAN